MIATKIVSLGAHISGNTPFHSSKEKSSMGQHTGSRDESDESCTSLDCYAVNVRTVLV